MIFLLSLRCRARLAWLSPRTTVTKPHPECTMVSSHCASVCMISPAVLWSLLSQCSCEMSLYWNALNPSRLNISRHKCSLIWRIFPPWNQLYIDKEIQKSIEREEVLTPSSTNMKRSYCSVCSPRFCGQLLQISQWRQLLLKPYVYPSNRTSHTVNLLK